MWERIVGWAVGEREGGPRCLFWTGSLKSAPEWTFLPPEWTQQLLARWRAADLLQRAVIWIFGLPRLQHFSSSPRVAWNNPEGDIDEGPSWGEAASSGEARRVFTILWVTIYILYCLGELVSAQIFPVPLALFITTFRGPNHLMDINGIEEELLLFISFLPSVFLYLLYYLLFLLFREIIFIFISI